MPRFKPCTVCGRLARASKCRTCSAAAPYRTAEWRQLSLMVTQRDGRCVRCGGNFRLSAHHVIPRAEGGADHPSNLVALCVTCHRAETAREHAEQRR